MTTTPAPRLISLFAGIGGFDLGFEAAGFTTVGQCEIDPHATQVLTRHWPTTPKHPDVTTLTPDTFGPAEVITFGSPCQDLSVAGKRAGLAGERSGLFTAAMDYIRAMQEATDGQYPRVVVWENVPGAFSSNAGNDFAAVLESMVGGSPRPTPPDGGWPNAGVAFGPQGSAEWRVLDSQYFGVAQRRRRIFVVYHPRGSRAGQVLLEPKSLRGNPSESNETRPHPTRPAPGRARGGSREGRGVDRNSERVTALTGGLGSGGPDAAHAQAGWLVPAPAKANTITTREGARLDPETETLLPVLNDQGGSRMEVSHGVTGTLRATSKGNEPIVAPPVAFKIRGGVEVDSAGKSAGKGYLGSEDKALTLGASQDQYLAEPRPPAIGFDHAAGAQHGLSEREEISPTLQASAGIGRAVAAIPIQDGRGMLKEQNGLGIGDPDSPSYTVDTTGAQAVAFALRGREHGAEPEISGDRTNALRGAGGGSSRDYVAHAISLQERGREGGRHLEMQDELSYALTAPQGGGRGHERVIAYGVVSKGNGEAFLTPERHTSLTSGGGQAGQGYPAVMAPVAFAQNSRNELRLEGGDGSRTGALSTGGGKPGQGTPTIATPYAVRRLTPRECERLQAFPDDWTRYAPDDSEIADTHRYRMCGNAVTVTVAAWIARRIMTELRQHHPMR